MINYQKIKRFNDIIFSIILGFFLLPIILFFCLLVYLDDFKNPLFFGYRVGKNSKLFKIFKIRSMKKGSEKYSATIHIKQKTAKRLYSEAINTIAPRWI